MTKVKAKSIYRGRKVLHITDFRPIFELPDDIRKNRPGPLTYTKSPVTLTAGSKVYDIKLWERFQELKSRPERHLLRSVFEDLKSWSGLKTIKERGYLVTTAGQPASYEYIAGQLKMDIEDIKKALPILEEIGLIERLRTKTQDKSGRRRTPPDKSGRRRTKTDKAGKKRKPLNKLNKPKGIKTNENKTNGNGKDNSKKRKKRQSNKESQHENPTPTTQPFEPQDPQKRGSVIPITAPSELKNTESVGDITKNMLHRYNPYAKRFAIEIYQALELPWDPRSEQGKRELGCFASIWHKIDSHKGDELWNRAVTEARKIARRRQNRKKGAVFCTVFKNLEPAYRKRKVK